MSDVTGERGRSETGEGITRYVEGLQADGRLLLLFLVRRPNRTLDTTLPNPASDPNDQTVAAYFLLTCDASEIVTDHVKLATLVACIDDLSRRAAPATAATIRLTAAYVGFVIEDGCTKPSSVGSAHDVQGHANKLRHRTNLVKSIALVATIVAVALLAYVDDGGRAMNQLKEYRLQLAAVYIALDRIEPEGWVELIAPIPASADPTSAPAPNPSTKGSPAVPYCWAAAGQRFRFPSAERVHGVSARQQCGALAEAELRLNLAFLRLQGWNMMSTVQRQTLPVFLWPGPNIFIIASQFPQRPANSDSRACPETSMGCPPSGDLTTHWKRTEIRTIAKVSLLTGFVLPVLLGLVGGCAFVIRQLTDKTSNWTLNYQDGAQSLARVLLAMILGGLLGVVWTGGETVSLSGVTLSLAAAAFFVGFSLEVVFSMIEAMVAGVADKLRAQVVQPVAAPPVVISTGSPAPRAESAKESVTPTPQPDKTVAAAAAGAVKERGAT